MKPFHGFFFTTVVLVTTAACTHDAATLPPNNDDTPRSGVDVRNTLDQAVDEIVGALADHAQVPPSAIHRDAGQGDGYVACSDEHTGWGRYSSDYVLIDSKLFVQDWNSLGATIDKIARPRFHWQIRNADPATRARHHLHQ